MNKQIKFTKETRIRKSRTKEKPFLYQGAEGCTCVHLSFLLSPAEQPLLALVCLFCLSCTQVDLPPHNSS
jgi:hypothetical protein